MDSVIYLSDATQEDMETIGRAIANSEEDRWAVTVWIPGTLLHEAKQRQEQLPVQPGLPDEGSGDRVPGSDSPGLGGSSDGSRNYGRTVTDGGFLYRLGGDEEGNGGEAS